VAEQLWPLFEYFPDAAKLPRVALRTRVTPVETLHAISPRLWVKRDDLTADSLGGNKVRALEFLLGQFAPGSRVTTAGSRGSTHVLATAVHARAFGMKVTAASWPQVMNPVATEVSARLDREITRRHFSDAVTASLWLQWRAWRGDSVIPAGGTSALGILGHVNAGLELAAQVHAGLLPPPARVVVPLGTGGTVAGLAVGFSLGGLRTTVVGARVVPRIIGRVGRVRSLMQQAIRLLGARPQAHVDVRIANGVYAGAYGRPLERAQELVGRLPVSMHADPTYAAKTLVAAAESARDAETLFWLTFDSRWITSRKTGNP
jgi:D-cysteine desulfhydrase